jgi:hypothetical protein
MQSQRRRFFPSCFDEIIKDFEDGRKALLLATIPLVEERDDDEEHPRVWQGRKVSKTPIIIYVCVYVYVRESPTPPKRRGKSEDIFIQIKKKINTSPQSKEQKRTPRKRRTHLSRSSRSFRAVFTGNASAVEETRALTFCIFFNTKSIFKGKRYFCSLSLGEF